METRFVRVFPKGSTEEVEVYVNPNRIIKIGNYSDGCNYVGTAYRLPTGQVAFGYDIEIEIFEGGNCNYSAYYFDTLRAFNAFVRSRRLR